MSLQRKDADAAAQSFVSFKDFKTPFLKEFLKEFNEAEKLPTASLTFVSNNFSLAVLKKVQWAERWIIQAATGGLIPQKRATALGSSYGAFFGALEYGICCKKFDADDANAILI